MEIKVDDLSSMSQAELEALEDDVVQEDSSVEGTGEEVLEATEPEKADETGTVDDSEKEESQQVDDEKPVEPADDEKSTKDTAESGSEMEAGADESTDEEGEEEVDEIQQHISPPSKWAAQRQALRESKAIIAENERIKAELAEKEKQIEWLAAQGVDTTKAPSDILSAEKIANIREEYGNELADMFQAVRALSGVKPSVPKPDTAKPVEKTAVADVQVQTQTDSTNLDAELQEAISDNDDLAYWQQHSKALWDKAVETNEIFLRDPGYVALSFKERFQHVVNKVQADAIEKAKTQTPEKQKDDEKKVDESLPPESLSGKGSAPTIIETSAIDKILTATPQEQAKIYAGLTEAERDKVDMELGI